MDSTRVIGRAERADAYAKALEDRREALSRAEGELAILEERKKALAAEVRAQRAHQQQLEKEYLRLSRSRTTAPPPSGPRAKRR
jgi:hypothetical protein